MEFLRKVRELPQEVQDYILGPECSARISESIDAHGIRFEKQKAYLGVLNSVLVKETPLESLMPQLQTALGLDPEAARNLARDVAGQVLLPLDKFLGDVTSYVRTLGGDPAKFPPDRIVVEERTFDEATAEAVAAPETSTFESRLQERLRDLALSFFKGIRTEPQVLEILQKSIKTGGLELTPEAASRILENFKAEAKTVKISEPIVPTATTPAVAPAKLDAPTPEDEAEANAHLSGILATKTAEQSAMTAGKIKNSVEKIYAAAGLTIPDEKLQARLRDVIGARLRDVRDALETLEVLVQPKELGGLSLSQDDARKVLKLIDDSLHAVREEHQKQVDAEKTKWLGDEAQKKLSANEATKTEDIAQLDTLYQSIVAKSAKAQAKAPAPMPKPPTAPLVVAAPIAPRPPMTPAEKLVPANLPIVETLPPALTAPVSLPPSHPIPTIIPKQPITLVRPAPQMAASPSVRPIMHDVKDMGGGAGLKLTGPAEELRTTTILDFRRLSKDPVVACEKIKDKVDLLHQQGYEKRTEGLVAWNESEVYRTYIQMMKEALEGKPMAQVISDRQIAKQPFLTPEEMKAVADLSRKLRY